MKSSSTGGLAPDLRKVVAVFADQLEASALSKPSDVVHHTINLLKAAALAHAPEPPAQISSSCVAAVTATIGAVCTTLLSAGPAHCEIAGVRDCVLSLLCSAQTRSDLSASLNALSSRGANAPAQLCDHAVSAIAGGPLERTVTIVAAPVPSDAELAVVEAAAAMDALRVLVVGPPVVAARVADRLRAPDNSDADIGSDPSAPPVIDARVVPTQALARAMRSPRAHALLLDAAAVVVVAERAAAPGNRRVKNAAEGVGREEGVFVRCGGAVAAAAARAEGVRVFALVLEWAVFEPSAAACVAGLEEARGHPGLVVDYSVVQGCKGKLGVLNPQFEFLPKTAVDVVLTENGPLAWGRS